MTRSDSCHCDLCCNGVNPILRQRKQQEIFPKLSLTMNVLKHTTTRSRSSHSKLPWKPQIFNQLDNQPIKQSTNQSANQPNNEPINQPTNQTASSISKSSWNTSNFIMQRLTFSSYVITIGQNSILTPVWTNSCKCKWKQ